MPLPTDSPEPDPNEIERALADLERSLTAETPDGYTDRVRDLEATVAEADRIREFPTGKVLARQQELAEANDIEELATREHVRKLHAAGTRERATLAAKAVRAAAHRTLATDPNIEALRLSRQRRARVAILWALLIGAMATTATTVQAFVASGAPEGSPAWVVGWLVDPALSALVVALLLTRGDLAGKDSLAGRQKGVVLLTEIGALLACLVMNVAPEIESHSPWGLVVGHVVMPLAAVAATLMIPNVQQRYQHRIDALSAAGSDLAVTPDGRGLTSDGRGGGEGAVTPGDPRSVEALRAELRELIERCPGMIDINSAESIRKHLRIGTTRARQLRDEIARNPQ